MRSTLKLVVLLGAPLLVLAGCGMPGEPKAPTLELPVPVTDLTAARTGDTVTLAWTMPKADTSKVPLKVNEPVPVRVCRAEGSGVCTNAGVLNLLPVPILDGGHLAFFVIELVIGRPVSKKSREIAQQVGLVLLISLMMLAFYNDIARMFMGKA